MSRKKLIKSTGIIGSATVLSRVMGFARDVLFANLFGTNMFAQAFVVAFRLPNMLRDMVGEGATDAAIVPVLTEYEHTRSRREYWEVAGVMFRLMVIVLAVLSVAGIALAPLLVRVIAPGFLRDPEKLRMTVLLTRIVFPYIFFLGLVAYSKGVLNSLNYFTAPAFAPVILNVTLILSILILCPRFGIKGMVLGVLAGGMLELAIQIPPLRARGFLPAWGNLLHPVVKRIGKLLLPRAIGSAVYQISVLIDTVLASLSWIVGAGGVAALYYSNRLVHLPLAVFGISLATAALPRMSKHAALNDIKGLKDTVQFSLRTVFTVMVPAAAGLMILAGPIIRTLFQRGEFTAYSTAITTNALFFYTFGLFAYAGIKILVSTFYSLGDTGTPVKTAAFCLLVNLALNLILMWPLKLGGLALATSIAAITNLVILYYLLRKRIGDVGTPEIARAFMKIIIATACMGVVTFFMGRSMLSDPAAGTAVSVFNLCVTVTCSALVYLVAGYLLRIEGILKLGSFLSGMKERAWKYLKS